MRDSKRRVSPIESARRTVEADQDLLQVYSTSGLPDAGGVARMDSALDFNSKEREPGIPVEVTFSIASYLPDNLTITRRYCIEWDRIREE